MVRSKEQEALIAGLFTEMYQAMFSYALCALGDRDRAEEAVQDSSRIACIRAGELQASESPRGWLMQTLKYVIKNNRKQGIRLSRMLILSLDELPPSAGAEDDHTELFYRDLTGDSEDYTLLRELADGSTMLEAARRRGISVEACKKRAQRSRRKLKKKLEDF